MPRVSSPAADCAAAGCVGARRHVLGEGAVKTRGEAPPRGAGGGAGGLSHDLEGKAGALGPRKCVTPDLLPSALTTLFLHQTQGRVHGAQARRGAGAPPPAVGGRAGLQWPLQPPHHGGGGLVVVCGTVWWGTASHSHTHTDTHSHTHTLTHSHTHTHTRTHTRTHTHTHTDAQVTAQCRENQTGVFVPIFKDVLRSFEPPPAKRM